MISAPTGAVAIEATIRRTMEASNPVPPVQPHGDRGAEDRPGFDSP
ncbi:MAG: hypothetical protein QME77_01995 [bacterium]|nr:hypothetical protein [bacterium]